MQSLNILFILTILLILGISSYAYYNKKYSDITIVKSTLDNNEYLVRKVDSSCPYTAEQAANILATLRRKCTDFIRNLNKKYMKDTQENTTTMKGVPENTTTIKGVQENTTVNRYENYFRNTVENNPKSETEKIENMDNKIFIERLTKNFKPNSLSESSSYHNGTSYSLNKGEKIVLCLRQKEDNCFVDMNTLMFVFLHELTHLGTVENKTHSPIFDRNFKFVLKEAIDQNLYRFHDYRANPVIYCGKPISEMPLRM